MSSFVSSVILFLTIFGLFIWSVYPKSYTKENIALIEKTLNVKLPSDCEISDYKYKQSEPFLPDYTIYLTVKFSETGMDSLKQQIRITPYYNKLKRYGKDRSKGLYGDEIAQHQSIEDSILKTPFRGGWIETKSGLEFIDFSGLKTQTNVDALINNEKRILTYEYLDW